MTDLLLGVDAGTTVTKAVLFEASGREVARASTRVPLMYPEPHHVERDQNRLFDAVVEAIASVLGMVDGAAARVRAVGITSHGDGIYLVGADGMPTRPGIMSLDTRAQGICERWEDNGIADAAEVLTGQRPWPSSPAALLAWLRETEPDVIAASAWALPAKDALRMRLCGVVSTEPTEASLAFTNVRTQVYDPEVIAIYGLSDIASMLPPVFPCDSAPGVVTAEAAALTGLLAGTPIAATAHDVDCSAIGTGVIAPGVVSVVAGSFSINQVVSDAPVTGKGWLARNFVTPDRWMNMSISPTSSTNMEWFTQQFAADELRRGAESGDAFRFVEDEIAGIDTDPSDVLFLPFLYGSPVNGPASGAFLGLQGWHTRGHLLRAVMEGVALTHRLHVRTLATAFTIKAARLTGGASRSDRWCQIFADALGMPVEVTQVDESGAWGAAMLAGISAGVFTSLDDAVAQSVHMERTFHPREGQLDAAISHYETALHTLDPYWKAFT